MLMFGNLLRECLKLDSLSQTAQTTLANLITIFLGITISFSMVAENFVSLETIMIMALGLVAFTIDTIGGVLFAKVINIFLPKGKKDQPNGWRRRHIGVPDVGTQRSTVKTIF